MSNPSPKLGDRVLCRPNWRRTTVTGTVAEVIPSSAFPYTIDQDEHAPGLSKLIVLAASEIVRVLP